MPLGFLWKIAGGAGTRGNLVSEAVVFCSNYGQKTDWKDGFDSRGDEALRVGSHALYSNSRLGFNWSFDCLQ